MLLLRYTAALFLLSHSKQRTEMKCRKHTCLRLQARLKKAGLKPKKHIMDDEVMADLRECTTETCKLELIPPGFCRRNMAEVTVKTFKKYFISILAGLPDSFPMRLWWELLPQAELTCNILRASHARPGIPAHAYMHGPNLTARHWPRWDVRSSATKRQQSAGHG